MINKRYTTLYKYITGEFLLAFTVSFLFYFAIFFVNQLLVIAKNILIANVSLVDVLKIIIYSVPVILSFTFPFASLTGASMTIGYFSSNNEITALQASGISLKRIMLPLLFVSVLLTGTSFILNDIFLPLGTIKYKELYRELIYRNPDLELHANTVTRFGNTIFISGSITDNEVSDLVILNPTSTGVSSIFSQKASFGNEEDADNSSILGISLDDVYGFTPRSASINDYDTFTADNMLYNVQMQSVNYNFMSVTPNDMSIRDVWKEIEAMREQQDIEKMTLYNRLENINFRLKYAYNLNFEESGNEVDFTDTKQEWQRHSAITQNTESLQNRKLQYYLVEFYKKSALPAACTALIIFAFPLSALRLRNGRIVGFGVGVIVSTIYWFMLLAAQSAGTRYYFPPLLLMWLPNIVFAAIGGIILYFRGKR